ncbi:MAG: autotransporter-associated beta strand repeat-containing protein [Pirellulales bacterium]
MLGCFVVARAAMAGQTWDGGGANALWSLPANWNGDTLPTLDNTTALTFGGTVNLSPDLDTNATTKGIVFAAAAGSFNLLSTNGSTLTIDSNASNNAVVVSSSNAQTISANLVLLNASGETNFIGTSGNLTLNGSIDFTRVMRMSPAAGRTMTINGALLNNGRFVTSDNGTIILNANAGSNWDNTGTGTSPGVIFSAGTLLLRGTLGATAAGQAVFGNTNASSTYNSALLFDDAAAVMNKPIALRVNNSATHSATIGTGPNLTGVYVIGQTISLGTTSGLSNNSTAASTGKLIVTAQNAAGTARFTNVISGLSGYANSVTKEGAGTVEFTAANTYSGPTVINTGVLKLSGSGTLAQATSR